jgi:hypothetical protein
VNLARSYLIKRLDNLLSHPETSASDSRCKCNSTELTMLWDVERSAMTKLSQEKAAEYQHSILAIENGGKYYNHLSAAFYVLVMKVSSGQCLL